MPGERLRAKISQTRSLLLTESGGAQNGHGKRAYDNQGTISSHHTQPICMPQQFKKKERGAPISFKRGGHFQCHALTVSLASHQGEDQNHGQGWWELAATSGQERSLQPLPLCRLWPVQHQSKFVTLMRGWGGVGWGAASALGPDILGLSSSGGNVDAIARPAR